MLFLTMQAVAAARQIPDRRGGAPIASGAEPRASRSRPVRLRREGPAQPPIGAERVQIA
jgi:hypothetical protein